MFCLEVKLNISLKRSAIEWLCVDIDGCKIVNVYKPQTSQLILTVTPVFPYPIFYEGSFNYQHTDWSYSYTNSDREYLVDWVDKRTLFLLCNPKDASSFISSCSMEPIPTCPLRLRV